MIKEVKITQIPEGALRRVAMPFVETVKCYECDIVEDLINESRNKPLELILINQTDKNGTIERHFLIGLAIPNRKDRFKNPLFYYVNVKNTRYEQIKNIVNQYKKDKSVLYGPDGVKLGLSDKSLN